MFALGLLAVGFGAVDLAMVAPLGAEHVAAVGVGESVVTLVGAFAVGFVDSFTGRLAQAEGAGETGRRLPVLVGGFLLALVPLQVLALVIALGIRPVLDLVGQSSEIVPLASTYVAVRMLGVVLNLAFASVMEVLKVCGLRNWSVAALVFGLTMNVLFDWLFLYGPAEGWFGSPEAAVATATVASQFLMGAFGLVVFVRGFAARQERFAWPARAEVVGESGSLLRVGSGVGVRHLNDYAGATIPFLMLGTLGVTTVAATAVATKIWTLYCRVPQACFTSSFVFYGYALGRGRDEAEAARGRLIRLSAAPTVIGALLVMAASPWLVVLFGGRSGDTGLGVVLVLAFFISLPLYFFEAFYGELLTVHQQGALLSVASTIVTYALIIPFAVFSIFVLHSAFWSIASTAIASIPTAVIFTSRYFRLVRSRDADVVPEPT